MKKHKHIGIIGGVGALASADFLFKFLSKYARDNRVTSDYDFPKISYLSSSIPGVSNRGVCNRGRVKKWLSSAIRLFITQKTDLIIAICVSITNILDEINLPKRIKLLSLARITNEYLNSRKFSGKSILVLCSESTSKVKPFYSSNCLVYYVDRSDQKKINIIINSIISGDFKNKQILFKKILEKYKANFILLGCTELSLLDFGNLSKFLINPLDIAIKKLI